MWFFDIFKKKKSSEKSLNNFFEKSKNDLLPGWNQQVNDMAKKIVESIGNNNVSVEEAENYYVKVKFMLSMWTNPGSIDRHTSTYYRWYTNRCFWWKLSDEQADNAFLTVLLWDQQARMLACWIWVFNIDTSEIIPESDEDELPDWKGKFGYVAENPIPVKGIISNNIYLDKLYTENWEKISYERTWSTKCGNIKWTIDIYEIYGKSGENIATLYIMPYFGHTSNKAPDWFILN